MNTPVSSPRTSTLRLSTAKGENQDSCGSMETPGASPAATLMIATVAKISIASTWAPIMKRWKWADSSVPSTQISVIAAMITIAKTVTAVLSSRRESRPRRSKM
jgi:uncharacterized membrane protein